MEISESDWFGAETSPARGRKNNHDAARLRDLTVTFRFSDIEMGGPDPSGTPHPPTRGLAPLVYLNIGSAILARLVLYSALPLCRAKELLDAF